MNRRKFIKKSLEGIVIAGGIGSIPLISNCVNNPFVSERGTLVEKLPSSFYLPLNVGNSWTYVNIGDGSTKTFNIIDTEEINGNTYFKFDDYFRVFGFPGFLGSEQQLFRYDPKSDKVLQYLCSKDKDIVRYDFNVNPLSNIGDMWGDYGNQLVLTGLDCTVHAGEFHDCFKFRFATLVDCGVFYEILAPSVGVIENAQGFELQSYTILY